MKFKQSTPVFRKKDSDYRFRQTIKFWGSLSSWFAPAQVIFEIDTSLEHHPCRNEAWRYAFKPEHCLVDGKDWVTWLKDSNLQGRVTAEFIFTAWYSTFLHDLQETCDMERSKISVAFTNRADAMAFKLAFGGPGLRCVKS